MFDDLRGILWRCWTGEFSLGRIFLTGAVAIVLALILFGYVAPHLASLLPNDYSPLGVLLAGLLFCPFPFLFLYGLFCFDAQVGVRVTQE